MQNLPFNIPKSLATYVDCFESDPEAAILRLKNHLKKRGPDAVGYFLLAWFYHVTNNNNLASKTALQAKTYAAGSPLMQNLHYYLLHPELFDADVPARTFKSTHKLLQAERTSPILDLDSLILMLDTVNTKRRELPIENDTDTPPDLSEPSVNIDDIASETLAKIHVKQGNKEEAVKIYRQLIKLDKAKEDIYKAEIKKLSK